MNTKDNQAALGTQRLSVDQLQRWEALKFGMFISFGMSTYVGAELPSGDDPSTLYAPDQLDVDQWVCVARDAGMKYAVLTAKHVAGHCLWPSKHTDYHVGTSGNRTDVVEVFVKACEKRGVLPGLYYCSWDNHHRFGSHTMTDALPFEKSLRAANPVYWGGVQLSFTTRRYQARPRKSRNCSRSTARLRRSGSTSPRCFRAVTARSFTTASPNFSRKLS
jgi:alpha-L-fucosidase